MSDYGIKYCKKCGFKLLPDSEFCSVCGAPIDKISTKDRKNGKSATGSNSIQLIATVKGQNNRLAQLFNNALAWLSDNRKRVLVVLLSILLISISGLFAYRVFIDNKVGRIQSKLTNATVGTIVTLGEYEQDNNSSNGPEPIEWIVIAEQGNKKLLISRVALDQSAFDNRSSRYGLSWITSKLRA